jgi:hypothetical protein
MTGGAKRLGDREGIGSFGNRGLAIPFCPTQRAQSGMMENLRPRPSSLPLSLSMRSERRECGILEYGAGKWRAKIEGTFRVSLARRKFVPCILWIPFLGLGLK